MDKDKLIDTAAVLVGAEQIKSAPGQYAVRLCPRDRRYFIVPEDALLSLGVRLARAYKGWMEDYQPIDMPDGWHPGLPLEAVPEGERRVCLGPDCYARRTDGHWHIENHSGTTSVLMPSWWTPRDRRGT